ERLERSAQRTLAMRGVQGQRHEIPPNTSRLWRVPSASGYTPLSLSRVDELLSMSGGVVGSEALLPENRALDLMAVRYFVVPAANGYDYPPPSIYDTVRGI